jgi:hypothetical protein
MRLVGRALWDRADRRSKAFHRLLGLEDIEDPEAARPLPGRVNLETLERQIGR